MKAIVFAEDSKVARELVSGAGQLGADTVIQVALGAEAANELAVEPSGASILAIVELPEGQALENAVSSLLDWLVAEQPQLVLSQPTRRLQVIVGSLAAANETAAVTNVEAIDADGVTTLYFGGIASRQTQPATSPAFYYVGKGVFAEDSPVAATAKAVIIPWVEPACPIEVLERQPLAKGTVDLSASSVVVSCGRGFSEQADLQLAYDLADAVGGGVGCTRPLAEAVDWFDRSAYIGVTGLMLTPRALVAVGVSGQTQHMIGVNKAEVIIAINKDKNAPVFKQCDLGFVGDLKTALPTLTGAL